MIAVVMRKTDRIRTAFREDRDFSLYVLAGVFIGMATGIYNTVFNNYLNDVYHLTSELRGAVITAHICSARPSWATASSGWGFAALE